MNTREIEINNDGIRLMLKNVNDRIKELFILIKNDVLHEKIKKQLDILIDKIAETMAMIEKIDITCTEYPIFVGAIRLVHHGLYAQLQNELHGDDYLSQYTEHDAYLRIGRFCNREDLCSQIPDASTQNLPENKKKGYNENYFNAVYPNFTEYNLALKGMVTLLSFVQLPVDKMKGQIISLIRSFFLNIRHSFQEVDEEQDKYDKLTRKQQHIKDFENGCVGIINISDLIIHPLMSVGAFLQALKDLGNFLLDPSSWLKKSKAYATKNWQYLSRASVRKFTIYNFGILFNRIKKSISYSFAFISSTIVSIVSRSMQRNRNFVRYFNYFL